MEIQALVNGRRITLEPLRMKQLRIQAREVESTLPCGFCVEWCSGTVNASGETFVLSSGAGMGNPWLEFTLEADGTTRYFCANIEDIVAAFIRFAHSTATPTLSTDKE